MGCWFRSATKEFQKANNLSDDGVFGAATEKKILECVYKGVGFKDFWDDIKYFQKDEFKCKCGGKYCNGYSVEPQEKLIRVADEIRAKFGKSAYVSSGIRCKTHNANVGGVSNSRHLSGKAMDFRISGKTSAELLAEVKKHSEIRYAYAIDGSYVHMDIE